MIGYLILAVLVAFIAVVAVRTIRFRPKPQPEVTKEEIAFDRDAAVDSLAQLVRCKTVSYNDHSLEDEGEFQKLISLLPTLYPNVFGNLHLPAASRPGAAAAVAGQAGRRPCRYDGAL